ncbi:hypothetical protein [Martelella sp. HB161492]|uniref:hypothetical protein n=1 Tax=Martelella sp. HB161492 TaxID=2720726 RepID=UPI001FEFE6F9|nr:hypothetical protein [Martelella sp. HB161492]
MGDTAIGWKPWPGAFSSSSGWGLKQFKALTAEERRQAEDCREPYLRICPKVERGPNKGEPKPVAIGVYLREKKFLDVMASAPRLVERSSQAATTVETARQAPFGPIWAARRMLALLDGPVEVELGDDIHRSMQGRYAIAKRMGERKALAFLQERNLSVGADGTLIFPDDFEAQERARRIPTEGYPLVHKLDADARGRQSIAVPTELQALKPLMEPVPVHSDMWARWEAWHAENGFAFVPDPGSMSVVYFPAGGPDDLDDFARAARSIINDGEADADATV